MTRVQTWSSADYKTPARRNADVKLEVSGAVRRTSATCAGVKNSRRFERGAHVGKPSERRRNMQNRRKVHWSELECYKFAEWPWVHSEVFLSSLNCRKFTRELLYYIFNSLKCCEFTPELFWVSLNAVSSLENCSEFAKKLWIHFSLHYILYYYQSYLQVA